MKTQKNKRAVTVGLFVAVGLIILLVGIFTLGGQQKSFVRAINVNAIFDDVAGLQIGNNIFFSGVKIGTVKKVEFYGNSKVRVQLHIEKKAQEFVRKDAKAKIGTDGLIGNKIIVIYGGTTAAEPIEGGETLIVEKAMSTDEMLATLQKNNENLVSITTDFKLVSKRLAEGQGTLGALLQDDKLFRSLEATMANLQIAARNSQKVTGGIAEYTAKLETPGSLADGLVNDTTIMTNLKQAVTQLNQATAGASEFADNLKRSGNQLNDTDNTLGMLLNDEEVGNDFKDLIQNLNTSSQKLDENLEALKHNFFFKGYFKKKAKREAKEAKEAKATVVDQSTKIN
jgi:phospholipid/cholesterol/gamma-HCH transport system substrate-binding protein